MFGDDSPTTSRNVVSFPCTCILYMLNPIGKHGCLSPGLNLDPTLVKDTRSVSGQAHRCQECDVATGSFEAGSLEKAAHRYAQDECYG